MEDNTEIQTEKSGQNTRKSGKKSPYFNASHVTLITPLLDSLPVGIIFFDPQLKVIFSNQKAKDVTVLENRIDQTLSNGTTHPYAPQQRWTEKLNSLLSDGDTLMIERINYAVKNKTKVVRMNISALDGDENSPAGIAVIEDITEKIDMQKQLSEFERLASIGRLASKVAHELNNPMDGILRYINLTLKIAEDKQLEKPQEYLDKCRQGLMRMVKIISELLEFTRKNHVVSEKLDIHQIIEDAIRTMHAESVHSHIKVNRNFSKQIAKVRDMNLFQVFCNLIKNALDAMPDGGELTISTRKTDDHMIAVQFKDTGCGLEKDTSDLIFKPFFTTKEKTKGTGLGLAICKDIISKYQGRITAENSDDAGSIFTVYLPSEV